MLENTIRTDLALEQAEVFLSDKNKKSGLEVSEYEEADGKVKVTKVSIVTRNAAKRMGKPMGDYITIEAQDLTDNEDGYHREVSECMAKELLAMLPEEKKKASILVVGLGNRAVTADSLGPKVIDHLYITRHLLRAYGKDAFGGKDVREISSLEPGVMAKTGMETLEIVRGVIKDVKPDILFVVDALAARSVKRLNRTIQMTNTGISPGSGVGNHRHALTQESLGIPVIAIGIPTVVDAATIARDAMNTGYEFSELNNMYLTGKDIDSVIGRVSFTVSEGLNMALAKEV